MSQEKEIVAYMREHGSIDIRRCARDLGCHTLSQRCGEINRKGKLLRSGEYIQNVHKMSTWGKYIIVSEGDSLSLEGI